MSNYGAIIAGTGSCLPEKRLTNDDLSKMVDTNDEWIVQRTGIRERRIAGDGETTATLGTAAAPQRDRGRRARAEGHRPDRLSRTITPEMVFPSHRLLRRRRRWACTATPAFDMSAACSGFIYALDTGANFIKAGQYKNVLVDRRRDAQPHRRLQGPQQLHPLRRRRRRGRAAAQRTTRSAA